MQDLPRAADHPGIRSFQWASDSASRACFKLGINRRFGEELQLERLEGRVTIFLEPVGIRLGLLLRQPHQRARNREQLGIKGISALVVEVSVGDPGGNLLGFGDLVPRRRLPLGDPGAAA